MLLFPAPSPAVVSGWVQLLTPLAIAILTMINVIAAKMSANRALAAQLATVEVKSALEIHNNRMDNKMDTLQATSDATHTLVNNAMAVQLRITAIALRRLAELTNSPTDIQAATEADKFLEIHMAKQAQVDAAIEKRNP